jgi:YVTN family beta-propeller protein
VSKIDLAQRAIVKTVGFPAGSQPWMLRVAPDGKTVWVQTGQAGTNVVLDTDTLDVLQTTAVGKQPVEAAFQPGDGRYGLVTHLAEPFVSVLDRASGRELTRIDVGQPQANAGFAPDGTTAFVTVTGANEVAVLDMAQLAVVARIPSGAQPMGLALLDPDAGPPQSPGS